MAGKEIFFKVKRCDAIIVDQRRQYQTWADSLKINFSSSAETIILAKKNSDEQLGKLNEECWDLSRKLEQGKELIKQYEIMKENQAEAIAELQERTSEAAIQVENQNKMILRELEKIDSKFLYGLGIRFECKGQTIRITFVFIDHAYPSKEFFVDLNCANLNKQWQIEGISHEIPLISTLIYQLNVTNNFREFVMRVRQEFKNLVN